MKALAQVLEFVALRRHLNLHSGRLHSDSLLLYIDFNSNHTYLAYHDLHQIQADRRSQGLDFLVENKRWTLSLLIPAPLSQEPAWPPPFPITPSGTSK